MEREVAQVTLRENELCYLAEEISLVDSIQEMVYGLLRCYYFMLCVKAVLQGLHDSGFRCFFIHGLSEEGGGKYLGCSGYFILRL